MTERATSKGGLDGVVAGDTAISQVDGERGELRYCGYLIKDLAAASNFIETTHLLWHGELPSTDQLSALDVDLRSLRDLSQEVLTVLRVVAKRQPPMDALRTAVSAMSSEAAPGGGEVGPERNRRRAMRLVACLPTIVAGYERLRNDDLPIEPRPDLDHSANFLYMLTGTEPNPEIAKILDTCLVLHADHELNASTFAARVTAATLADIWASVTAAIGTLSGPLHGGANTAVMRMLLSIGDEDAAEAWVERLLGRGERVMGFGHRVYKTVDPRAEILKEFSRRLGELTGQPKWYRMSRAIEKRVQAAKGIAPNVDFYSASSYYAMGVPPDLYTCLFAMARISGWTAHIMEQYANNRLIRPVARWVGAAPRPYTAIEQRAP